MLDNIQYFPAFLFGKILSPMCMVCHIAGTKYLKFQNSMYGQDPIIQSRLTIYTILKFQVTTTQVKCCTCFASLLFLQSLLLEFTAVQTMF